MEAPTPRDGQRLVAFYEDAPKKNANRVGVDQRPLAEAATFELQAPAIVGVVYVTHPHDPRHLIPFADYDEELARDKLNEALRVFTALGASRIVATSERHERSRFDVGVGGRKRGLKIGRERHSTWNLTFDQRGVGGKPVDPRPLLYPDEPGFDAVCEGVLRLGVQRGRIEITRSSQFDLDGELAVRLRKAHFQLGFGGKRSLVNEFVIEAAFTPEAATELDEIVEAAVQDLPPRRGVQRFRRHQARG